MNSELIKHLALSGDDSPQLRTSQRSQVHESAILKLKGLPYDTSKQQVLDFFQGFDVKDISFVFEPDGRPSGLAFAEFLSRDEAIRAMAKNGEFIGERYVKLLLVPRQEMEEQVRMGTIAIPGGAARARAGLLKRRGMRLPLHSNMPGMPGTVDMLLNVMPNGATMLSPHPYSQPHAAFSTPVPVRDMFPAENFLYLQHLAHMPKAMHQGMPMQGGQMMPQAQLAMQAMHLQSQMRMPLPPPMPPLPHLGMHPHSPQMASPMPPSAQLYAPQPATLHHSALHQPPAHQPALHPPHPQLPPPSHSPVPPPAAPGAAGQDTAAAYAPSSSSGAPPNSTQDVKTLKVRGLPFRVTPAELMQFFWGYEFLPESVAFGKDALGRPSGEAWLTFTSHQEAVRAVAERNRRYLRNRYLELSLWHG